MSMNSLLSARGLTCLAVFWTLTLSPASAAPAEHPGIARLVSALGKSLSAGDARGLAELFAADADFTNVIDQSVSGRENIYRHHIGVFANRPRTRAVAVLTHKARMLKPDVAVIEVRWNNTHSPEADGTRRPDRHGVWVAVATKVRERWLFKVVRNVMLSDGT